MATIHSTTLIPSKLDLLRPWLAGRPWYGGTGTPLLTKAGGFRLDDPDGEVGIEVMVVADRGGPRYVVPMTYRAAPLDRADALLGTAEHGVLGRRWIYDGVRDPVAVDQLLALVAGRVEAQHQNVSDTLDPSVRPAPALPGPIRARHPLSVTDTASGTTVALQPGGLALRVVRLLTDDTPSPAEVVAAVEAEVPELGRRRVLLVER
jgi:hypothetical protein